MVGTPTTELPPSSPVFTTFQSIHMLTVPICVPNTRFKDMTKPASKSPNWGGARPNSGAKCFNANSARMREHLVNKVMESETDPTDVVLEIMANKEEPANIRLAAIGLLYQHILPKQKQMDVTVTNELDGLTLDEKVAKVTALRQSILELRPDMALPQLPIIEGTVVNVSD
jgi:hypothetical protein